MRQSFSIIEEEGFIPCHQCGEKEELKECVECMDNFCLKCFGSHILDKHVYIYYLYICIIDIYIYIIHIDIYIYIWVYLQMNIV